MKRFWDTASIEAEAEGFSIRLDGKPMRVPSGAILVVGPKALAHAIATEWQVAGGSKGGEMSFEDTPLTRLAGTAQEQIAPNPEPVIDAIAGYAESDLLCYRADTPSELVQRQERLWQPWLDWIAEAYGAPLRATVGVGHVRQDEASITTLRRAVAAQDVWTLAGLGLAVPALGSLVLGLALADGALDAATAVDLGALDELFQAGLWGEDREALRRRAGVRAEIELAGRFIVLSREIAA